MHQAPLGASLLGRAAPPGASVYLNLTPLLDVMSNILFFLLAAFGASAVAAIAATVPVDASQAVHAQRGAIDPLSVMMDIGTQDIVLRCHDPQKSAAQLRVCVQHYALAAQLRAPAALGAGLLRIKQAFPTASTLVVSGHGALAYSDLVQLLDVARSTSSPQGDVRPLFDHVVMAAPAP